MTLLVGEWGQGQESNHDWQMLEQGMACHKTGEYEQAEDAYRQFIQEHPDDSAGYYLLGLLGLQAGKCEMASLLFKAALELYPDNPLYVLNLGNAYFARKMLTEAQECYEQAVDLDPASFEAHFNLGTVLLEQGKNQEAIDPLDFSVQLKQDDPRPFARLARALIALDRLDEAEEIARAAGNLDPKDTATIVTVADNFLNLNTPWESLPWIQRLLDREPINVQFRLKMANALSLAGLQPKAEIQARMALQLAPDRPMIYKILAQTLTGSSSWDEALEVAEQGLQLAPNNPALITQKAALLERKGRYQDAYHLIRPLFFNVNTFNVQAAMLLATISRKWGVQQESVDMLEDLIAQDDSGQSQVSTVSFQLAELYDDLGQYDKAFEALQRANDLSPRSYTPKNNDEFLASLREVFTPDFFARAPRAGHGSRRPIFIVGMPRSGTSLTEQILSTHSQVFGAGELSHIGEISHKIGAWMNLNQRYPQTVVHMSQEIANQAAQLYLERIAEQAPEDMLRVTDKMPGNFSQLGLIALLFPQAKIIHCRRNPLDTCLSCYFQNFAAAGLGFAYHLEDLAHYYRFYDQIMNHWYQTLPLPIYTSNYEELVVSSEEKAKELLEFCELPWEEECLRFYKNKREVKTASYNQVRNPIYQKSANRWRNYAQHLEPLRQALGEEILAPYME